MREYFRRAFGCDVRSLAVFRIALGLLLLADIAWRLPHFDAWLTETGVWPIAAARAENSLAWSLYFLSGAPAWTITLLCCSALAALALIAGWRTRLFTVISWLLLCSLQARNELPINAGDLVLRLLLFWGMFLPLSACWSVDARGRPKAGTITSVATAALFVQVALIYFFNALYKTGDAWTNGSAISAVLQQETYATSFGRSLLDWPWLLKLATHGTWWFELLGPLLLFSPWKTGVARGCVAIGFILFHLALFATLRIGLFPLICVAAWVPILPSGFWNALSGPREASREAGTWRGLEILAGVALIMVVASNIALFAKRVRPAWWRASSNVLRLDQQWSLFAPNPSRSEGWTVVVIEGNDGREYNAETGTEMDWARPADLGAELPSAQWRKFLASMRSQRHPRRVERFADWHVARWKAKHPEIGVRRVRVHYLWEGLATRQNPPDNWFIFEKPHGPLSEEAKRLGYPVRPPSDAADL